MSEEISIEEQLEVLKGYVAYTAMFGQHLSIIGMSLERIHEYVLKGDLESPKKPLEAAIETLSELLEHFAEGTSMVMSLLDVPPQNIFRELSVANDLPEDIKELLRSRIIPSIIESFKEHRDNMTDDEYNHLVEEFQVIMSALDTDSLNDVVKYMEGNKEEFFDGLMEYINEKKEEDNE